MKVMPVSLINNFRKVNFNANNMHSNVFLKNNEFDTVSFRGVKENTFNDAVPMQYEHVCRNTYGAGIMASRKEAEILHKMSKKANKIIDMANEVNQDAEKYRTTVLNSLSARDDSKNIRITDAEYEKSFDGKRKDSGNRFDSEIRDVTLVDIFEPDENLKIRGVVDKKSGNVEWVKTTTGVSSSKADDNSNFIHIAVYGFQENGQLEKYKKAEFEKEGDDYTPVGNSTKMEFLANQIKYEKKENGKITEEVELLLQDGGFLRYASIKDKDGNMKKTTFTRNGGLDNAEAGLLESCVWENGKKCYSNDEIKDTCFQKEKLEPIYPEPDYSRERKGTTFFWG